MPCLRIAELKFNNSPVQKPGSELTMNFNSEANYLFSQRIIINCSISHCLTVSL
jgi:hypothetical protein